MNAQPPSTPLPQSDTQQVVTSDGVSLCARVFEPRGGSSTDLVIIHSAIATPQRYYARFAAYLAQHGARVVTYDYRGIGESRQGSVRDTDATLMDWAERDAVAIVRTFTQRYPASRLLVVGHSFGGQVATALPDVPAPERTLLVASGRGYIGHHPNPSRARVLAKFVSPLVTSVMGYFPGALGFGEDLPAGVMNQWMRWAQRPEYFLRTHPEIGARMVNYGGEITALSFTDDPIAPLPNVQWLVQRHSQARVTYRYVDPLDVGMARIDHHGAFRASARDALWDAMREGIIGEVLPGAAPFADLPDSRGRKHRRLRISLDELRQDLDYGRVA